MIELTDRELLLFWEKAFHQPLIERCLLLLAAAYPDCDLQKAASLSIGNRDARLVELREKLFGPVLRNTANCPACDQRIEWETPVSAFKLQPVNGDVAERELELAYEGNPVVFRLPNSRDVLEVLKVDDDNLKADLLVRKCILETALPVKQMETVPEELRRAITQKMAEQDPQADITLNIQCPECNYRWTLVFDIMQYLWTEINDRTVKLLQDIYLLANTFGWSERSILDMSRFRRNLYVNMING